MLPFHRLGIWSRLLMAFSFISAITVLVGIIALLIFNSSKQVVAQLAEEHIPELIQVSDFVKLGGQIVAVAPNILSTDDESTREAVHRDLDSLVSRLKQRLQSLTVARPALHTSLESLVKRLETNLTDLQLSVNRQSALQRRLNRITERLRWLYIDLIGEVDPLKQDYTYNLEAEIERVIDAAWEGQKRISADELQVSRMAKESVEKVRSDGVLLVSLMVQGASSESMPQVDHLSALSADTVATLREDMARLKDDVGALTLRSVMEDIYALADGGDSVFVVRRSLLSNAIRGREILKQNRLLVAELESAINDIVVQAEQVAGQATASTRLILRRAKTSMILMVLVSLVTVVVVMLFYVRGSIVARLSALSTSMRAIAGGDLDHQVPAGGSDEIGRMAEALRVFRDTAQAVEEANAQAIIDNAAVGLVLADTDGTIRLCNPEAAQLFRAEGGDMVGTCLHEIVCDDDRDRFIHHCVRVLDTKGSSKVCDTLSGRRRDGSDFPVDIFIRKVLQRRASRLMITLHDVTERELAHELLRVRVREKTDHLRRINVKLRAEVKERRRIESELVQTGKLAALGQFSAGIAHELNQPLSAIRYYLHNAVKLLERGQTKVHQDNLTKMEELVERMARMINHLKTFARYQSDLLQEVDVTRAIGRALELLNGQLEKGGIEVIRRYPSGGCTAWADAARLEQVLVNILSNGIDAAGENGRQGLLTVTVTENKASLAIAIGDNGPGIQVDPPEAVFDPFYTTKEVGRGLGLGLSIAYSIVKGFGGRITAANQKKGGACFSVILQKSKEVQP
jgi:two-component system, NtrC family, phosphoglycerate transport system sensor histidine kinase PgtB